MDALRDKLKWLMGIRVAVVTLTLGVLIYLQIGRSTQAIPAYYGLIVGTYLLTILYSLLVNRIQRLVLFAYLQIGLDILFEAVLVAITGGVESPFSLLFILSITTASALLSRKGGLAAASTAGILYGAIVDLQYYRSTYQVGLFEWLPGTDLLVTEMFYNLSLNLLGFIMIGYLSGTLAEKLRSTGERLEEKDRDLTGLREFHQFVLESIDSGLFTTNLEGRLRSFNRRAEEIMGYSQAEVRGRLWWEVFGWPAPTGQSGILPAGMSHRLEEVGRRKDGTPLFLAMSLAPLQARGLSAGIVGVFQDITDLKKKEDELRSKQWLATIGELSAGLAHEIRNPLASLSGAIQEMRKDLDRPDLNRPLLDLALRETERLNGIVSDFLQYARPRPLNLKQCDINELVQDTIHLLEQTPDYGGQIRFVRQLAPDGVVAMVDPDQMRQVCWNLGLNACQAMPAGGTLTVAIRWLAPPIGGTEGESIEIVFEDTGPGIPKEHLDKLFYPFFTTKEGGTGLGLSLVHRIMDEHKGSVQVESAPGKGTRVTLTLPITGAAAQEAN
ncbi:MAG: PAS domain S-box protein [Nitrospirae bacterium]|nr:MAG: PAS domain S-box protein [Nitrospirota bacterium]